jgi:gamma-glutamyltranspeptidase/glutathione hydrolase
MFRHRLFSLAAAAALGVTLSGQTPSSSAGAQDPAWSPDGRRLAFSFLDRIWTAAADGRSGKPLVPVSVSVERDPAWSGDGRSIAFAADAGAGFDIQVTSSDGGTPRRLTTLDGDERWPSFTRDNRVVFSHRHDVPRGPWQLYVSAADGSGAAPLFPDSHKDDEREPRVSPDGSRVAYISDRDSEDGDVDLWVAELTPRSRDKVRRTRLTRVRGREGFPSWSPDGTRLAFYASREGVGSVWVSSVDPPVDGDESDADAGTRPTAPLSLVSRHGGVPAWSPDGRRIVIGDLPPPEPGYNGNPLRDTGDGPPLFVSGAFRLWTIDAPQPIDAGARELAMATPRPPQLVAAFDRVWETLKRMYYAAGPAAAEWDRLKATHRPRAEAARDEAALETVVDDLIAAQPLIKPPLLSSRAVVVSGHPLASAAGVTALEKGGNVVDAAIAVSFALGVVEPDASGIGGDGMAVVYLKGMPEPVVVDYKDQVPIRATRDNPILQASAGAGPAAANTPGVVAGMDLLHRRFGSKKVTWADLLAPAIGHAQNGYVLDAALPTSIAEGRRLLEKYDAASRIYLPGGKVPAAGDRLSNPDYAATLRAIAADGADSFYRGAIANRIADDMARNGGLITLDDLAQYRAIERRPLSGRYRDHVVFSSPPPVSTGQSLIETLQILQHYKPTTGASYASDADYFHHAIEAWKVRDAAPRIADPALWDVNLGSHLDPAHAETLFKRIDPAKASRYRSDTPDGERPERIGRGTTAFAVADAEGNMIAVTQTLSTWGGTFYVSEGLGFLYNNHLRFGRGAPPGRFLPLARSSSTSVPTLLFKAGRAGTPGEPRLAVAAAGNAWIPASVYDIILNVVDTGMAAQKAIEAPRFLIGRDPVDNGLARIQIEDRIPRAILQDLTGRGHRFQKIGRKGEVRYGYAAAVVVDTARKEVQGGAEPRRSHGAAAPK